MPSHASSLRRCRLVIILGRRLSALWPRAGFRRHAEPRGRDHGAHGVRGHHLVDAAGQRAVQAGRSGMKRAYYAPGEISATQGSHALCGICEYPSGDGAYAGGAAPDIGAEGRVSMRRLNCAQVGSQTIGASGPGTRSRSFANAGQKGGVRPLGTVENSHVPLVDLRNGGASVHDRRVGHCKPDTATLIAYLSLARARGIANFPARQASRQFVFTRPPPRTPHDRRSTTLDRPMARQVLASTKRESQTVTNI